MILDSASERLDPGAFLIGRHARMADLFFKKEQREFGKLVKALRLRNWRKTDGWRRLYARTRDAILARQRERRLAHVATARGRVFACSECKAEFCRVPVDGGLRSGPAPEFCGMRCYQRRYQRERYRARVVTVTSAGAGELLGTTRALAHFSDESGAI